jgi:hypothetical protein
VSLWRVLLMSRIVSVVNGIRFGKTFEWVLLGATIEVILVVFVGGIFSPAFSRAIIRGMGGMRNAPEENLLLNTLFAVGTGAVVLLGLVAITAIFRSSGDFRAQAFPKQVRGKIPGAGVAALTAGWVAIATPAQLEQRRFNEHSGLVLNGSHRESLDYLRTKSKSDFPPARRLEPNPYEYRLWEHLPGVLATLRADDPAWVKEHYFGYMEIVFDHDMLRGNLKEWANAFETMGNLPEGERWISRHRKELKEWYDNQVGTYNDDREAAEFLQLYNVLNELGVLTRTGAPESGAVPPSPTN